MHVYVLFSYLPFDVRINRSNKRFYDSLDFLILRDLKDFLIS